MVKILEFNNSNKKYNFDNISKETCKSICQTIKIGKDKIKNPLTNNIINYNSDITKQILQVCYKKYKMKEVKDIVDIEKLFESFNIKKSNKKGGLINYYDNILSKCKELYNNYTYEKLILLLINLELISDKFANNTENINYFVNYFDSCKYIENNSKIHINKLVEHFAIILNLFAINNLNNKIVCYDNNFIHLKNELFYFDKITADYNISPGNNLTDNFLSIVSNNFYDMNKDDILFNSLFNRIYVFNKKEDNTFLFEPNIIISNTPDITELILKYNKTIPKYFSCKDSDDNKLINLIAFLNAFSQEFKDNIEIIEENTEKEFNIVNQIYPDKEVNKTLTAILQNNVSFIKRGENTNIIHNNFKGTAGYSVLSVYDFLYNLYSIQVFDISSTLELNNLKQMEKFYKNIEGNGSFSADLNIELFNLITTPYFVLSQEIKNRLLKVFTYVNFTRKIEKIQTIYSFHGTKQKLHGNMISAFLSTSLNINIAIGYARYGSSFINKVYVYIFRIPNNIDYVSFDDILKQVLLLPGTIIKIIKEIEYNKHNVTYIYCDIVPPKNNYFAKNLLKKIILNTPDSLLLSFNNMTFNNIISYDPEDYERKTTIIENKIYITHDNNYIFMNLLQECNNMLNPFLNLKYTIHQLIINKIYQYFQKDSCVSYNIINYDNGEFLIGIENNYKVTTLVTDNNFKYDFNLLIVDLLCNAELSNNLCFVISSNNNLIRTWFKLSGIFDGIANQNTFIKSFDNIDRINSIIDNEIRTNISDAKLYRNINKTQEVKDEILKMILNNMNQLGMFRERNILESILNDIIHLIDNVLQIPRTNKIYPELMELIQIIRNYFNCKIEYMLNFGYINITQLIYNEIDKILGGDNHLGVSFKSFKQSKSSKPFKSLKPLKLLITSDSKLKKANISKILRNTNTTIYDINGYEIAPIGYSSMITINYDDLDDKLKKYYKQKPDLEMLKKYYKLKDSSNSRNSLSSS
tara:strand:+ start:2239 stop:5175 length:2937 start_codon:yes stop_codon:yes gene_type:complete